MSRLMIAVTIMASLVDGFSIAPRVAMRPVARTAAVTMGIEDSAANCLEEGCSVDALADLLTELKAESKELSKRHQAVLVLIGRLQALSASPADNRGEIEKLVGAASRTFMRSETYDFPGEALGYTLKPSKGGEKQLM